MRRLALVLVSACFGPRIQPGSPCDPGPCPDPLVCSSDTHTCQAHDIDAGVIGGGSDSFVTTDGCVPSREYCGDGIDQDCDGIDPPCPANDLPSGAIDITAGGDFTADVTFAHDDNNNTGGPCGMGGGRDVFYEIKLQAGEVYYLDTFGSDYDTVVRVYDDTPCIDVVAGPDSCHNNACGTMQTQVAETMHGVSCIVVDQISSAETHGSLKLHVEPGRREGNRIANNGADSNTGDTSTSGNDSTGTCAAVGNDDGWYFTACPAQTLHVVATTCNPATTWDTALYAIGPTGELVCGSDDALCIANPLASAIVTQVSGAHLFWLIVDSGAVDAAGPYELDTTIQ